MLSNKWSSEPDDYKVNLPSLPPLGIALKLAKVAAFEYSNDDKTIVKT